MAWWSWKWSVQPPQVERSIPEQRDPFEVPDDLSGIDDLPPAPTTYESDRTPAITVRRIAAALDVLDVRYLSDGEESLLALWERHALLFAVEGPDDEILVIRARPHATVPRELSDLAYRTVNEWNHSRRFAKAYVGDPSDRGELPVYAEWQIPLRSGIHDALLREIVDTSAAVSATFVDWLHSELL